MQKLLLVILVILIGYCSSEAQSLKAISQSGYEEIYSVSNNLKITFDSTAFVFSKGGSIIKKWGYGEVRKIVYADISTRIDENILSLESERVHVYPQPANEQITVSYHIPEQSPIHLLMYSIYGSLIHRYDAGVLERGHNASTITIPSFVPIGSYILCVQGNTFSYSIPIIHSEGQ